MAKKTITTRNPEKYEYAYLLFMQKVPQKEICEKVGITPATLGKWKESGGWAEKRAAKTISINELMNKALTKIAEMLDSPDFNADSFSKAVSQLKTLKLGVTTDDKIIAYMSFGDYLIAESATDKELTTEFIRKVTVYQDKYILTCYKDGGNQ